MTIKTINNSSSKKNKETMMKKLLTILVVFALCGVAMADVTGRSSAKEQFPLQNGTNLDYINFKTDTEQGSSGLKYTVYNSFDKANGNRMANVYFTTMSQADLNEYNATNNKNVEKITVQFVGAQWDVSGETTPWQGDYGIYYNENGRLKIMSVAQYNNAFELNPGQSFGVYYYKPGYGYVGTTYGSGYVGNYDTGSEDLSDPDHLGMNKISVYDYNEEGEIVKTDDWTYKKFMCLFLDDYANPKHWEFMLQTRLDDPKVSVRPEDVTEELPAASGQPLPGTLATLLIGGLCAKTLSKKNKKH